MVSVNENVPGSLLPDLYSSLMEKLKKCNPGDVEHLFVLWMLNDVTVPTRIYFPAGYDVTDYHHVAKLSYAYEIDSHGYENYKSRLEDGLKRMAGRLSRLPDDQPAPFCNDVVAIFGLAIGARRIGGTVKTDIMRWMTGFVKPDNDMLPPWKRLLLFAALDLVGHNPHPQDIDQLNNVEDIKLALNSKGAVSWAKIDLDLAYKTAAHLSMTEQASPVAIACRAAALQYLTSQLPAISLSIPTTVQVEGLLSNISIGLKRWPWESKAKTRTGVAQHWDIQNEYHVQSLAYFILAAIFPDIESEFYLEQTGQKNSRADLGLPSMHLIVEVKFLRHGVSFANMIEEVAADASLYFQTNSVYSNKYSQMLVLLWDNSSRTQEYHEFKKGVKRLPNVVGAVVIPRPGDMPVLTESAEVK